MDPDRLLAECMKLEPQERARLIDELQATLPPELTATPDDWSSEYREELERRARSVREGSAQEISADEFFRRLTKRA